uniref:Mobile element protein n=1 Tax=Klebsiella pneumoniae TaxID=573 RepID=A0A6G9HLZ1_KLEPN|nr:Mobile element protein [Klebsiella pneumoniae]
MPHVAARTASRDRDTGRYQSHRPEQTLLYNGILFPRLDEFRA